MDLAILDSPQALSLTGLLVSDLAALDAALDAESALLKRRKETLAAMLARRFEDDARKRLVALGQDTGTVNLAMNGLTVKVVFAKKVEWNQPKLMAALNAMKPEDARHYAKVEMKVDERKFTAAPPAIQNALKDARTVKVAKPTFSFAVENSEAA